MTEKTTKNEFGELVEYLDGKFTGIDRRFDKVESQLKTKVDKSDLTAESLRLEGKLQLEMQRMEQRLNQKLDKLITTLDAFLKQMTDLREEFTFLKEDLKRVKAVIREKLGVVLD